MRHTISGFRKLWIVFFILIILVVGIRGFLFVGVKNEGHHIYCITVHNFTGDQTYMTTEYAVDSVSGCLKFKDEFGLKNTVCGNYSITEW